MPPWFVFGLFLPYRRRLLPRGGVQVIYIIFVYHCRGSVAEFFLTSREVDLLRASWPPQSSLKLSEKG